MKRKKSVVVLPCAVLTILILLVCLAGCGASAGTVTQDEPNEREGSADGYIIAHELSDSEREIADLVAMGSDFGIYDYQLPESCSTIEIKLQTWEQGKLVDEQPMQGMDVTNDADLQGTVSIVIDDKRVGVKLQTGESSAVSFAETGYLQQPEFGVCSAVQLGGEIDGQEPLLLYAVGIGEDAEKEYPDLADDLQAAREAYDSMVVVVAVVGY